MINKKKLITVFSILASVAISLTVGAQDKQEYLKRMYMPPNLKGDIHDGFSADWNGGASIDARVEDLKDGFNNLSDKITLRNMRLSADLKYSMFGLRTTIQDQYQGSIDNDLNVKLREFYVGANFSHNVIMIFGRMDSPILNQVTQRSVDINDPIARLNLDDQRYLVATVDITPELSGVMKDLSVQLSAYNDQRQDHITAKAVGDMNSLAIKVKKILGPIFAQVTYANPHSGGHQVDASAQVAPIGTFTPYVQGRWIRGDATLGDTDAYTIGLSTTVISDKTTLYLEGSRIKTRNSAVLSARTQNDATLGIRQALNDYLDVFAEYSTNVATPAGSIKDQSVFVGARVHGKDESPNSSYNLFSAAKKK
jgi:hypothetical protein